MKAIRESITPIIVTTTILVVGFLLLHVGVVDYGVTYFLFFPFSLGYTIATLERKKQALISFFYGSIFFIGFLLVLSLEGLFCVICAMPFVFLSAMLGFYLHNWLEDDEEEDTRPLYVSIIPLFVLILINPLERFIMQEPALEVIENSIVLDFPSDLVFDKVKSMDNLDAEKPLGISLGLPAPYKCVLQADSIGSKRICYFKNGTITAQITKYDKGKILEMDVIEYNLTGKEWFKFVDASYSFNKEDEKTKITRTSSYKSVLRPRFYWRAIEHWGIEQEHKFVLKSLQKNLKESYRDEPK